MTYGLHPQVPDVTEEMWTAIDAVISRNRSIPGSVVTILRECEDIVGYLPVELIDYITERRV